MISHLQGFSILLVAALGVLITKNLATNYDSDDDEDDDDNFVAQKFLFLGYHVKPFQ